MCVNYVVDENISVAFYGLKLITSMRFLMGCCDGAYTLLCRFILSPSLDNKILYIMRTIVVNKMKQGQKR